VRVYRFAANFNPHPALRADLSRRERVLRLRDWIPFSWSLFYSREIWLFVRFVLRLILPSDFGAVYANAGVCGPSC
jgi:hypothetical protein